MRRRIRARELAAFGLTCFLIFSCAPSITVSDINKYEKQQDVEKLIAALHSKDWNVASHAVAALGKVDDPRAVEALIDALRIRRPSVAAEAARSLGRKKDPRAVEPLLFLFQENHRGVNVYPAAAWALGELGDRRAVIPLCLDLLLPWGRGQSARALGKIKDSRAVEVLIIALEFQDDRRSNSAWALKEITGKDFGEDRSKWRMWFEQNKDKFQ